jgi:hypothetical protein
MVTFIEADAEKYAQLAKETGKNVMVHREPDDTLTCEIDGVKFHTDNAWQLSSRLNEQGFYGYSLWLDSVFSEPGVMLDATKEGE